jgi:hypothetical protein
MVSKIGLESFAGLPASISPAALPINMWMRIRSTLSDMCPLFSYRELSEHQTAIVERLSRALLHFLLKLSLDSFDESLIKCFLERSPFNLRVMALEGLCLNQGLCFRRVGDFMERILKLPPIDPQLLHPLIHRRIIKGVAALERDWTPPMDNCKWILRSLASNLSPDRPPTLQEEVMFHLLYLEMQKKGVSKCAMKVTVVRNLFFTIFYDSLLIE